MADQALPTNTDAKVGPSNDAKSNPPKKQTVVDGDQASTKPKKPRGQRGGKRVQKAKKKDLEDKEPRDNSWTRETGRPGWSLFGDVNDGYPEKDVKPKTGCYTALVQKAQREAPRQSYSAKIERRQLREKKREQNRASWSDASSQHSQEAGETKSACEATIKRRQRRDRARERDGETRKDVRNIAAGSGDVRFPPARTDKGLTSYEQAFVNLGDKTDYVPKANHEGSSRGFYISREFVSSNRKPEPASTSYTSSSKGQDKKKKFPKNKQKQKVENQSSAASGNSEIEKDLDGYEVPKKSNFKEDISITVNVCQGTRKVNVSPKKADVHVDSIDADLLRKDLFNVAGGGHTEQTVIRPSSAQLEGKISSGKDARPKSEMADKPKGKDAKKPNSRKNKKIQENSERPGSSNSQAPVDQDVDKLAAGGANKSKKKKSPNKKQAKNSPKPEQVETSSNVESSVYDLVKGRSTALVDKEETKPGTGSRNRKDSGKINDEKMVDGKNMTPRREGSGNSNRRTPRQTPDNRKKSDPQTPQSEPAKPNGSTGKSKNKNRKQNNNNKKKAYEQYLPHEVVSEGLKRGTIIEGKIRINPKNFEDAYVPHPDGKSDIYIRGTRERNRALNGDVVAVLLNPRQDWKVLIDDLNESHAPLVDEQEADDVIVEEDEVTEISVEKITENGEEISGSDKFENVNNSAVNMETAAGDSVQVEGANKGPENTQPLDTAAGDSCQIEAISKSVNDLKIVDLEVENSEEKAAGKKDTPNKTPRQKRDRKNSYTPLKFLKADNPICQQLFSNLDEATGDKFLQRTGKVVYITEKVHSRAASGFLKLMPDKNKNMALFSPMDNRMPRMKIPMGQCPEGFVDRPDDSASTIFIARVIDWEMETNFAIGQMMKSLGQAGEIEPETEAILMSHDVDFAEFPDEALDCLPKNLPWKIPDSEFDYRKDLRKKCIFTIDPATARDLDDALSCEYLADGIYEIGVHIADVSFFVHDFTALNAIARSRATSVYLVQKVIPMLPRLLCEQLCSLNPDEDRLAFSVIWKMTEDGEILEEWFGRTVIRSCAKLSYDHAQGFLDQPDKAWCTTELPPISEGFCIDDIKKRVLTFDKVAKNLRKQRFDKGALRLDQVKLQFTLDSETGLPNGYRVYEQKDSNRLIEEFMLLANMAVAHKIYDTYPKLAFLRRHPEPQQKLLDDLTEQCKKYGFELDGSSAGALQRTLFTYENDDPESKAKLQILSAMCSKPMQLAKYFCSGIFDEGEEEKFRHYALNVPLYTHFTSPIRRFADVMVHRELAAAIGLTDEPETSPEHLQKIADNCNTRKDNSKKVQELSSDLFFAVFVHECGPLEESGRVMQVLDKSFDVLMLKLGVIKRVYCDALSIDGFSFRKVQKCPTLLLDWGLGVKQTLSVFSEVDCVLEGMSKDPLKWYATIKRPSS